MSNKDYTTSVNNALENDPAPSWADLLRAERTAGGPAVSEGIRDEGPGRAGPFSSPIPAPSQTDAPPTTRITRLVGFHKIRVLLQPLHKFYKDKYAWIKGFHIYSDKDCELAYPDIRASHKDNPYRRYKLSHKASARTFNRLKKFVEERKLSDFQVCSMVLTMPKFMSEYITGKGKPGRNMAWRLFEGFWAEDLPAVINQNIELGSHTNMHLWRTEEPTKPHVHFHTLIPNYGLRIEKCKVRKIEKFTSEISCPKCEEKKWWKSVGDGSQWHCETCYPINVEDSTEYRANELKLWDWHRQRGGRLVPFSDIQMETLKGLWRERLSRFCHRHGLQDIGGKIDIYIEYIDTWQKLHHRLNYNGRHWSENYAEYSSQNLDCPEPPDWLLNYENRARCKGWWSNLKNIVIEDKEDKEKISPYTGERMSYMNHTDIEGLLEGANGRLGVVEFVRGRAIEGILADSEISWLEGVMAYNDNVGYQEVTN